jgi:hypothetical protein
VLIAADDLLAKANRALTDGDLQRAGHFIDRAAALNSDEHEQPAPAAYAAGMMLFTAVTDTLERSREGDSRWLDAAVETLSSCDGWGQSEMRHTLLVVRQDYIIEPSESRTIGVAVAQVPERAENARCHAGAERTCCGGDVGAAGPADLPSGTHDLWRVIHASGRRTRFGGNTWSCAAAGQLEGPRRRCVTPPMNDVDHVDVGE